MDRLDLLVPDEGGNARTGRVPGREVIES